MTRFNPSVRVLDGTLGNHATGAPGGGTKFGGGALIRMTIPASRSVGMAVGDAERGHLDLGPALPPDSALTSAILSRWAQKAASICSAVARRLPVTWIRRPRASARGAVCTIESLFAAAAAQSVHGVRPASASTASVSRRPGAARCRGRAGRADSLGTMPGTCTVVAGQCAWSASSSSTSRAR